MDYPDAIAWLYGRQQLGINPGLEVIRRLLSGFGFDGHGQRFIHVAGTNGKGSVCAMLDSICRADGLRTGLYTSPHLVSFRERIRLDGRQIPEEAIAAGLSKIAKNIADTGDDPTFFEIATALAFDYFQETRADVVILETGLGGRLDATNVITPVVSVITAIDLDHTALLGDTLEKIAAEKAGIIKPGVPVVSTPQHEDAARVLVGIAAAKHAPLEFIREAETIPVSLAGSHQQLNAALAIAALRAGNIAVGPGSIRAGLGDVSWPGRFQRVTPQKSTATDALQRTRSDGQALNQRPGFQIKNPVILDGAHNASAAKRLAATWREVFGDEKCVIVLGILKDKDMASICRELLPVAAAFILTPVNSQRTSHPHELRSIIRGFNPGIECLVAGDFQGALAMARARTEKILITGSLFLVGEALAFFEDSGTRPEMSSQ